MQEKFGKSMNKRQISCVVILLTLLLWVPSIAGQAVDIRPLTKEQLAVLKSKLDRALLPEHATAPEPEQAQSFRMTAGSEQSFYLVPVRFSVQIPSIVKGITTAIHDCGVYIVPEQETAAAQFVWTVGSDAGTAGAIQCTRTVAVGAEAIAGSRPTLILLEEVSTPSGYLRQPRILQWNIPRMRYEINESLSADAENAPGTLTIQSIKRQLFKNH